MTWNYRVVRRVTPHETIYAIHEAYYKKNGSCYAITESAVGAVGESTAECQRAWAMMAEAFKAPVLDYETRKNVTKAVTK